MSGTVIDLAAAERPRVLVLPISRELRAVWEELDALPAAESDAPADQLAAAREARRAAAKKASGQ